MRIELPHPLGIAEQYTPTKEGKIFDPISGEYRLKHAKKEGEEESEYKLSIRLFNRPTTISTMKNKSTKKYRTIMILGRGDFEKGHYRLQEITEEKRKELNRYFKKLAKKRQMQKFARFIGIHRSNIDRDIKIVNTKISHFSYLSKVCMMIKKYKQFEEMNYGK